MKRREFLQTAALGLAASAAVSAQKKPQPRVMTVLGEMPANGLGRTLMHEHVMVDFIGADKIAPGRYDPEEVFKIALAHLEKLKAVGGQTLVECTPEYIGRDVSLLRRLSKASGLHIITNTGFYGAAEDKYVPAVAYKESVDELAMRWSREFEDGIPPDNVRPGIIKIGVDSGPLSQIDAKLVRAAARTQKRTGLAIASHTGNGVAALAELAVLKEEGVDLSAFIWVHAQNESDASIHHQAAAQGAWVEFDGISSKSIAQHVDLVLGMKRAGFLRNVLISQDAGWYHVGEPEGGEFRGYETLFTEFLPALRKAGATEDDAQTLLVRNPHRALALRG
ncbi:MAG: phosphotriesterase [Terriglobia bacterium]